jgi:hypothetical protein
MYASMSATPFNKAFFQATHNSYSGTGGPIREQLDSGIRGIEFDIRYDSGFKVGHDSPGDNVSHSGNPSSNDLDDWLRIVTDWSDANSGHDPIMLFLDAKESLSSHLNDLNTLIKSVIGPKLFKAATYKQIGWPTVAELRGKILVILSGDNGTRVNYADPANEYSQRLFAESQKDDSTSVQGAVFYAAEANSDSQSGDPSWVAGKQNAGKVVRLWMFKSEDTGGTAPNLAATDSPYDDWYSCYSFQHNAFTDIVTGATFDEFSSTQLKIPIEGPRGANTLYVVNGVASFTFRGRCGPDYNSWARTTITFPAYTSPAGELVVQAMIIGGPASCKSTSGTMIGWSVDNTSARWFSLSDSRAQVHTPGEIFSRVVVSADIAVFCSSNQALLRMACQLLIFARTPSH